MRSPLYYIKKWWSMTKGWNHGLTMQGPWKVRYNDGKVSRRLEYGEARSLAKRHGGKVFYIPDEKAKD